MVRLEKGKYPLLLRVVMADGEFQASAAFEKVTDDEAKTLLADPTRQALYAHAAEAFKVDLAQWKASDGADPLWNQDNRWYAHWNSLNCQLGIGNGGFQAEGEGYTLECFQVQHDYALAHQKVYGRGVTGLPDISHFVPRYVETASFAPSREGG